MLADSVPIAGHRTAPAYEPMLRCPCGYAVDCRSIAVCSTCPIQADCARAIFGIGFRISSIERGRISQCPSCRAIHRFDELGRPVLDPGTRRSGS